MKQTRTITITEYVCDYCDNKAHWRYRSGVELCNACAIEDFRSYHPEVTQAEALSELAHSVERIMQGSHA